MAKAKGSKVPRKLGVDKIKTAKVREIPQIKGVGNPGTTTYTGKPGINRPGKKGK